MYMSVEFWKDGQLQHNAIVTAEECAEHFHAYRGSEHRITGFYTKAEVENMSPDERGLAHLFWIGA